MDAPTLTDWMTPRTPLEMADFWRRAQGRWMENLLDVGPSESPFRVTWRQRGVALRAYEGSAEGPPVLTIPAPIKRPYLWDLAPEASAVRQLLRSGPVYLMDWDCPTKEHKDLGLADYADRLIRGCLDVIQQQTGRERVFLAGHSLGGTLSAIFAALAPERVQGLILLESPLHFGPEVDAFGSWAAVAPPASLITAALGNVPGTFLDVICSLAAPEAFQWARWLDWLASLGDSKAARMHLRVERWTLDESPLAQKLFEEVIEWLYREDRFLRGTLSVAGKLADPRRVTAPVLSVVARNSNVVPPQAVLPFHDAVGSSNCTTLWYDGDIGVALQHLGSLIGTNAHRRLWPAILRWIRDRAY